MLKKEELLDWELNRAMVKDRESSGESRRKGGGQEKWENSKRRGERRG